MSTVVASIISYVALTLGAPCRQVFIDTVLLERPSAASEMPLLEEFAEVSCRTDNPDLLWQVALVESDFQFMMASINQEEGPSVVLTGEDARRYLQRLRKSKAKTNVDIGVIQMNWAAHAKGFNYDPVKMLGPKNQVSYLIENMVDDLVAHCGKNWVGCYHSYANGQRAHHYYRTVKASGKKLKKLALKVLALRQRERAAKDSAVRENGGGGALWPMDHTKDSTNHFLENR